MANVVTSYFNTSSTGPSSVKAEMPLNLYSNKFRSIKALVKSRPDFVVIPQHGLNSILLAFVPEQCQLFAASLPGGKLSINDCDKLNETNKVLFCTSQLNHTNYIFPLSTLKSSPHPLFSNEMAAFAMYLVDHTSVTTIEVNTLLDDLRRMGREYMGLKCWRLLSTPLMCVMTMSVYQRLAAHLAEFFGPSPHCTILHGSSVCTANSILTTPDLMMFVPDNFIAQPEKMSQLYRIIEDAKTYEGESNMEEVNMEELIVPVSLAQHAATGVCLTEDDVTDSQAFDSSVEGWESHWSSDSKSPLQSSEPSIHWMTSLPLANKTERIIFNVLTTPTITVSENPAFAQNVFEDLKKQAGASLVKYLGPLCDQKVVCGTGETSKQKFVRMALGNDATGVRGKDWLGYQDRPDIVKHLKGIWDRHRFDDVEGMTLKFDFKFHVELPIFWQILERVEVVQRARECRVGGQTIHRYLWCIVGKAVQEVTQKLRGR